MNNSKDISSEPEREKNKNLTRFNSHIFRISDFSLCIWKACENKVFAHSGFRTSKLYIDR